MDQNNFKNIDVFIVVLIVILVVLYANNMYETYVSGSYDITPSITTNMDWKGSTLSKLPYFTNNLINPPADVLSKIQNLQTYQSQQDGSTDTTYVTKSMDKQANIDNPNTREGFTMMNPYVSN